MVESSAMPPHPPVDDHQAIRDIWYIVHDTNRQLISVSKRLVLVEDWQAERKLTLAREEGVRAGQALITKRQGAVIATLTGVLIVVANIGSIVLDRVFG